MSYNLLDQVKRHEGFRDKPYTCTAGALTIGYGWNLDAGIEEEDAEYILMKQLSRVQLHCLRSFDWYRNISEPRRDVITNMVFNLGMGGFKKFKKMIKAIEEGDHERVVNEMLDSKWAHQVKDRAWELADQWRDDAFSVR